MKLTTIKSCGWICHRRRRAVNINMPQCHVRVVNLNLISAVTTWDRVTLIMSYEWVNVLFKKLIILKRNTAITQWQAIYGSNRATFIPVCIYVQCKEVSYYTLCLSGLLVFRTFNEVTLKQPKGSSVILGNESKTDRCRTYSSFCFYLK